MNKNPISINSYQCLALDIGGVICADPWESIFLAPKIGLAEHYQLDEQEVLKHGKEIWKHFAYTSQQEEDYWKEWEKTLGYNLDRDLIQSLYEEVVWVDSTIVAIVQECLSCDIAVAIVSNSTSFWYPRQIEAAGLNSVEDKLDKYLSHEVGYDKIHAQGGLSLLAAKIKPDAILFVDDRQGNIDVATEMGMDVIHYDRKVHQNLGKTIVF